MSKLFDGETVAPINPAADPPGGEEQFQRLLRFFSGGWQGLVPVEAPSADTLSAEESFQVAQSFQAEEPFPVLPDDPGFSSQPQTAATLFDNENQPEPVPESESGEPESVTRKAAKRAALTGMDEFNAAEQPWVGNLSERTQAVQVAFEAQGNENPGDLPTTAPHPSQESTDGLSADAPSRVEREATGARGVARDADTTLPQPGQFTRSGESGKRGREVESHPVETDPGDRIGAPNRESQLEVAGRPSQRPIEFAIPNADSPAPDPRPVPTTAATPADAAPVQSPFEQSVAPATIPQGRERVDQPVTFAGGPKGVPQDPEPWVGPWEGDPSPGRVNPVEQSQQSSVVNRSGRLSLDRPVETGGEPVRPESFGRNDFQHLKPASEFPVPERRDWTQAVGRPASETLHQLRAVPAPPAIPASDPVAAKLGLSESARSSQNEMPAPGMGRVEFAQGESIREESGARGALNVSEAVRFLGGADRVAESAESPAAAPILPRHPVLESQPPVKTPSQPSDVSPQGEQIGAVRKESAPGKSHQRTMPENTLSQQAASSEATEILVEDRRSGGTVRTFPEADLDPDSLGSAMAFALDLAKQRGPLPTTPVEPLPRPVETAPVRPDFSQPVPARLPVETVYPAERPRPRATPLAGTGRGTNEQKPLDGWGSVLSQLQLRKGVDQPRPEPTNLEDHPRTRSGDTSSSAPKEPMAPSRMELSAAHSREESKMTTIAAPDQSRGLEPQMASQSPASEVVAAAHVEGTTRPAALENTQPVVNPEESARPLPDAHEISEQIVQHARLQELPGSLRFEVRLKPEALGLVTIETVLDENRNLQAKILAEDPAVQELLRSELRVLQESFREAGIRLDRIEVDQLPTTSFDTESGADRQNREQQQNRSPMNGRSSKGDDSAQEFFDKESERVSYSDGRLHFFA